MEKAIGNWLIARWRARLRRRRNPDFVSVGTRQRIGIGWLVVYRRRGWLFDAAADERLPARGGDVVQEPCGWVGDEVRVEHEGRQPLPLACEEVLTLEER